MNRRNRHPLLFLVILFLAVLAGCESIAILDPAGPVAESQRDLLYLSLIVMIIVMFVVFAIFTYVIIRFRQKPGDENIPDQVEGNTKLEIIWVIVPIILLIILAVPTVTTTFSLAEQFPDTALLDEQELAELDALRVQVVARQYWWEFTYPDQEIVTAQEAIIPVGKRVYFEITSVDDGVIHSFWLPRLGGKVDANPGLINPLWLQADETGTFQGRCAELCGESHAFMDFHVTAVEPDEFDQWVNSMKGFDHEQPSASGTQAVEMGREIFAQSCMSCHGLESSIASPGPNLVGFGDRQLLAAYLENNAVNLYDWIEDPQAMKPGAQMPSAADLGLDDQDIDALVQYLHQLTLDR